MNHALKAVLEKALTDPVSSRYYVHKAHRNTITESLVKNDRDTETGIFSELSQTYEKAQLHGL